jgi:hypothetical protein
MCSEPLQSEPLESNALMCVEEAPEGVEGSGSGGAAALVRRFSGEGGAPSELPEPKAPSASCGDAAMEALADCAIRRVGGGGAVLATIAGLACLREVNSWLTCVSKRDEVAP